MTNEISIVNNKGLPRMRTIPKAYAEIKELDPDTSFTIRALREMIKTGEIPTIKVKSRILINVDLLIEKLNNNWYNNNTTTYIS